MDQGADWGKDMYKIDAVLKSPLMIGGKKLNSNYRESKNYIPGSVLRAAYAKALIQRCACGQKNNYLTFQGQSQCRTCAFQTVCKHFSEISFPVLYPMGGSPYPVTARGKKYQQEGEIGIYDILKSRLVTQAKVPGESGWRRLEGIHLDGQEIKLIHSAITRTAVDYHRNAAKEGSLYTQNVISEKYKDHNDELSEVWFSGNIRLSPQAAAELSQIRLLYIGADTTRGFGACYMSYGEVPEDSTAENIRKRIYNFNEGIGGGQQFVILDLLTDAYLELEKIGTDAISQTDLSDSQMITFLEEEIGLKRQTYQLQKAFKFQEVYRGFDTSEETEAIRKGRLVVKAGAVFVYQRCGQHFDIEELLKLELQGIGKYTKHGFGKIRVCDSFHINYDVLGGKKDGKRDTSYN